MKETSRCLEGIGQGKIARIVMGKLKIGVDLLEAVEEIAERENIRTGVILSGIGALQKAVFRNAKVIPADYKMKDNYRLYMEIEQSLELLSLSGWIATTADGQRNIHAHLSASTVMDDKVVTLGGHLTKGTITSIKDVVVIGVIEDSNIKAVLNTKLNQFDVDFGD
jgi:predicted DNA-binding protein with PD1-like motif